MSKQQRPKPAVLLGYRDHAFGLDLEKDASTELTINVEGPADGGFTSCLAVALEDRKQRQAVVEQVLNLDPESDQVPDKLRDGLRGVQQMARCLARA